jgi:ElaB/YqjD/DUF883 family membrane-anchored ribosome-binding protein
VGAVRTALRGHAMADEVDPELAQQAARSEKIVTDWAHQPADIREAIRRSIRSALENTGHVFAEKDQECIANARRDANPALLALVDKLLASPVRNDVVFMFCINAWRAGQCTLEEAVCAALGELANRNAELMKAMVYGPSPLKSVWAVARRLDQSSVTLVGANGLCLCDAATTCPLGKAGSALKCTAAELRWGGVTVQLAAPPPPDVDRPITIDGQ